jgi:FMN-dependent NADH-azoreductase
MQEALIQPATGTCTKPLTASKSGEMPCEYLLRIKVSPRESDSFSLRLLDEFTDQMKVLFPNLSILDRETFSIPHLSNTELAAGRVDISKHTPEQQEAFKLADELTTELINAQAIIIATPMYNWGPPSSLKAWIDRVINIRTFYGKKPLAGLPVTFIISSGGIYTTGPAASMDSLRPQLRTWFTAMGSHAAELQFIDCEGTGAIDSGRIDISDESSGYTKALLKINQSAKLIKTSRQESH